MLKFYMKNGETFVIKTNDNHAVTYERLSELVELLEASEVKFITFDDKNGPVSIRISEIVAIEGGEQIARGNKKSPCESQQRL